MSKFVRPRLKPPKSKKKPKAPKASITAEGKRPTVKVTKKEPDKEPGKKKDRGSFKELSDAILATAPSKPEATPEFASVLKESEAKKLKEIAWPKMARPGVAGPAITYYIGDEVEVTAHFGMPTLFVVGNPPPVEEIIEEAKKHKIRNREICHIRLGANESFDRNTVEAFKERAQQLVSVGLCVTLDVPFVDVALLHPFPIIQQAERFVLAITMPWPGIRKLTGGQAVFRISDTFLGDNGGIWIARLEDMTRDGYFSNWRWYAHDQVIR